MLFDEAEGWGVKFEFVTERFEDTAIGRFHLSVRSLRPLRLLARMGTLVAPSNSE
ncbi:MAG: hypothetical protein Kow0010_17720 [Dehalococcoidia bacterium]